MNRTTTLRGLLSVGCTLFLLAGCDLLGSQDEDSTPATSSSSTTQGTSSRNNTSSAVSSSSESNGSSGTASSAASSSSGTVVITGAIVGEWVYPESDEDGTSFEFLSNGTFRISSTLAECYIGGTYAVSGNILSLNLTAALTTCDNFEPDETPDANFRIVTLNGVEVLEIKDLADSWESADQLYRPGTQPPPPPPVERSGTLNEWTTDSLTNTSRVVEFTYSVTSGTTLYVKMDDADNSEEWVDATISLVRPNGTVYGGLNEMDYMSSVESFEALDAQVIVRIQPLSSGEGEFRVYLGTEDPSIDEIIEEGTVDQWNMGYLSPDEAGVFRYSIAVDPLTEYWVMLGDIDNHGEYDSLVVDAKITLRRPNGDVYDNYNNADVIGYTLSPITTQDNILIVEITPFGEGETGSGFAGVWVGSDNTTPPDMLLEAH